MKDQIRNVTTAREVVRAIDRYRLMALTGASTNSITNWIAVGHFPPTHYCVMQDELTAIGVKAPRSLWRQIRQQRRPARDRIRPDQHRRVERISA